jgi:hypothetical protein
MSVFLSLFLLQAAGAAGTTPSMTVAPPDDAKIVCKTITPTGSRLGGKRTCLSKKEWRRLQAESEQATRESQDNQSKQPGNQ